MNNEPDWDREQEHARGLSTEKLQSWLDFVALMKPPGANTPKVDKLVAIYEQVLWERSGRKPS
jgi:hypothetical protein